MKLSKGIALLFFCTIILTSCNTTTIKDKDADKTNPNKSNLQGDILQGIDLSFADTAENVAYTVSTNGTVYIGYKDIIRVYNSKGEEVGKIKVSHDGETSPIRIMSLACSDNSLYVSTDIVEYKDKIWYSVIKQFDFNNKFTKDYLFKLNGSEKGVVVPNTFKMIYFNNRLFINMYNVGDVWEQQLIIYSLQDSSIKSVDIGNITNVSSFIPYNDQEALILCDSYVTRYNYDKDEVEEETFLQGLSYNIVYDYERDLFYAIQGKKLLTAALNNKTINSKFHKEFNDVNKLVYSNNQVYYIDEYLKKLMSVSVLEKEEKETLKILANDMFSTFVIMDDAIEEFNKKYPNVTVELNTYGEEYRESLSKKVMAEDTDFDLYYLFSMDTPSYIRNKAMKDLKEYPQINDKFNEFFDGVKNLSSYKDYIFGTPVFLNNDFFIPNKELFRELKLQIPDKTWTWEDFYNLAKQVKATKKDAYITRMLKEELWFFMLTMYDAKHTNNVEKTVNYNTEEFKRLLELFKSFYSEDLIKDDDYYGEEEDNVLLILTSLGGDGTKLKNGIIPWPLYDSASKYTNISAGYLAINKSSNKDTMAADFLACWISKEVQAKNPFNSNLILYKDKTVYKDTRYGIMMDSDDFYNTYKDIIDNSSRFETIEDVRSSAYEYVDKYLNDEISVEEIIDFLEKEMKLRMLG